MDYAALATSVDSLLRSVGTVGKLSRAGVTIGSGSCVFVASTAKDETRSSSSVLASTSTTSRSLYLTGLAKEPLVGDTVLADKVTYLVTAVERIRPASTTVVYRLEVMG